MVSLSNNTQGNVNITTRNDTDINANTNGNSQRAKSWAVGEGLIDGVDYSAKYYAEQAKESEEIASHAIEDIDTAKDEAIAEMETAKEEKINEIENTAADFEDDLTALTQRAETAADNAETSETNAANSVTNAAESATRASTSATNATRAATSAAESANLALGYRNDAYNSEMTATSMATDTQTYASYARGYMDASQGWANQATIMAGNSRNSATAAVTARDAAQGYAQQAEQAKKDIEAELDNYVQTSRQINGKDLTNDITLTSSDVGALSNTTKYGSSLQLSLDSSTYVLTATLKDQDGNTLGTSQTVDFPVEQLVMDVNWNSTTKAIDITLKNGTTTSIPASEITNGLQPTIDSTNKLSSDLVDDTNSTHKFATAAQLNQIATNTNNISNLATVATSGSYNDLADKPYIPSGVVIDQTFDGTSANAQSGVAIQNELSTNYVTTDTTQDISGRKTFLGEKAIYFKQTATTDKLGFTLYNPSSTELGALEWRPNTINGNAILTLNCPQSGSNYVGFRYWSNINIIAPRPTTNGNYFIPVNVTDGTNTVTANNNGTLNISSLLPDVSDMATKTWVTTTLTDYALLTDIPTVNNGTLTIQKNGTTVGTFTANQSTNSTINIEADTVLTDDITVSKNLDDELQTIGVIDDNSKNAYNFTVVGSPTITEDGIASGFSSNSFLQISINLSNKPFIFETPKFVYSQVASDRQYLFTYGSYNINLFMQTFITSTGALNTSMRNNNTDIFYKTYQLTLNNSYQIKYVLNNTEASIYLKTNDNDYELWYTTTNTSLYTVNNINMRIGQENNGSTRFYLGSIDLKQFSITVDGVEVYRAWQPPALKYWSGTKAQYDAIVTKDTNTLYNVEGVGLYKGTTLISNDGANKDLSNLSATGQAVIDGKADTTLSNVSSIDSSSAVATALNGKADTDLSNLSATGKTVIDGQWIIRVQQNVVNNLNLHNSNYSPYPVDLSNYLPNDGYNYEVIVSGYMETENTSGRYCAFVVNSDLGYGVFLSNGKPRTDASVVSAGNGTIVVGTDRKLYIVRQNNYYGTAATLDLKGYRRVGTNA